MLVAIGKVTVPAPGTIVQATITQNDPTARYAVHGVLIEVLPTNTGFIYLGDKTLNKATNVGNFYILAIPTKYSLPSFSAALTLAPAAVQLGQIYFDADVPGDGVLISVLVA